MAIQNVPTACECKMAFHVKRGPLFLVVALHGEATFDQAEVISAQLLRVPLNGYKLVVLDLAGLTSMSTLDLGALIEYRRGLARRGIEVRLANVPAQVWLMLESADLRKLFEPMELAQPTLPRAQDRG